MALATHHYLSFSRILLGGLVLSELAYQSTSYLVLPLVLAAAGADWLDGRMARAAGAESMTGRLIDNLCDAGFLALAFTGFALQETWSDPVLGSATRYWDHANWLPLMAFTLAFSLYLLRWAICHSTGKPLLPSLRGHSAGIFNYVLAVIGGVAVLPDFELTRWILEPAFVTVALLNATAASENVMLMFGIRTS